jgi:ABC-type proline/glycine betaine transport system permease subunit
MSGVIAATILVVVLAFAADGLLALAQRAVTPEGLALPKEIHSIVPPTEQVEIAA